MKIKFLRETALCAVAASLLVACGGGTLAGISGTGITSEGTVTSFGSVFVNGVEFDTANAAIIVNGERVTEAELRVGQVVTVKGTLDDETHGTAETVVFDRLLDGPIETLNPERTIMTALGQTVRVSDQTRFVGVTRAELNELNLVAVSGFVNGNGEIVATLVQLGSETFVYGTSTDLEGVVSGLDPIASTFNIGNLTVDYRSVLVNETAGSLANGATVQVLGTQTERGGIFTASRVEVVDTRLAAPGERLELEGIITEFSGAGDFTVGNQRVDASSATREGASNVALGAGVRLEVEGEIAGNGILVAVSFAIRPVSNIRIRAALGLVNAAKGLVTALGVPIRVAPDAQLQNIDSGGARREGLSSLRFSDYVQIDAYRDARGVLVPGAIVRADFDTEATVRGPVTANGCESATNTLEIAGVPVRLEVASLAAADGRRMDLNAFCTSVRPGDVLRANGLDNGNELIADQIFFAD